MYFVALKVVGNTKGSQEQSSGAMFSTGRGKGKDKVLGK